MSLTDDEKRAEIARLQAELEQTGATAMDAPQLAPARDSSVGSIRGLLIGGGVVLLAAAIGAGIYFGRAKDADDATDVVVVTTSATPSPTPTEFFTSGTMTISKYDAYVVGGALSAEDGASCSGDGGYDDIRLGAQVVVRADGRTVAVSELEDGVVDGDDCSFSFTVDHIPEGHAFYSVEVAGRGELEYSRHEVEGPLGFTLG